MYPLTRSTVVALAVTLAVMLAGMLAVPFMPSPVSALQEPPLQQSTSTALSGEQVFTLKSYGNVRIEGSLYFPEQAAASSAAGVVSDTNTANANQTVQKYPAILLLHMWNSNRQEWDPLIPKLLEAGFAVCSIDFRGHGKSSGKQNKYYPHDTADKMIYDAIEAHKFMLSNASIDPSNISLGGASIGTTVAVQLCKYLNNGRRPAPVRSLVLISPAAYYFAIPIDDDIRKCGKTALYFILEKQDPTPKKNRVFRSGQALYESFKGEKKITIYDGVGHGIKMLAQPELPGEIVEWFSSHAR